MAHSPGPNCPKEIVRLSEKAKSNSSQRSVLFEHWLTANENWQTSKLLIRLRSSKKNRKAGLRRWMLFTEMVAKWGEEVATAMKESKEADEERSKSEIREHPDVKGRKDMCMYATFKMSMVLPA